MNTIFRRSLRGLCALFLALALIFQAVPLLGGDSHDQSGHTAYAAADCGISTCTCASCGWTYTYPSTQHFTHVKCTGCSASYGLQWENHSFSGNTCTVCGYTKSGGGGTVTPGCSHGSYTCVYEQNGASGHYRVQLCRYCGEQTDCWLEGHSLTSSCNYLNTSYHTYESHCTACGYTAANSRQPHTWSYRYSPNTSGQHRVDMTCSGCGYSTYSYQDLRGRPGAAGHTPQGRLYLPGWFTAESNGTQVTTGTVYNTASASTYYAHWELIPVFSVTVPVVLPLAVAEDGTVHTAQGQAIRNSSTGAVQVTGVTLSVVFILQWA